MDRIKTAAELPGSNRNGSCSETGNGVHMGEVFGELCAVARRFLHEMAENSPNSPGVYNQRAVYPEDSILADWMRFAREQVESADAFIIGSILPVCSALLGRRVYVQWGEQRIFPNCFNMLAGKPGDRKSSVIDLAEILARRVPLPESAFISQAFSAETLFDEYDEEAGGRPDKLWIQDDANATLTDWRKAPHGERIAPRFLSLYDCHGISEHFRRNKAGKEGRRRTIAETSTSLLFGATFNIACFQGQAVREGLASRFLYYVAENHGRLIVRPRRRDDLGLDALARGFHELEKVSSEMNLSTRAELLWEQYQKANRYEKDQTDLLMDAKQSRLSRAPMQVLKLAMIFEAARFAKNGISPLFGPGGAWRGIIEEGTLSCAIEHIKGCLEASEFLDSIANRAEIAQQAEIFFAHVRRDFPQRQYDGFIIVSRTDLTRHFCNNSGRRGSWKPDDLYLRFIPHLERRGEACVLPQRGKQEWFAFQAE